MIIEIMDCVGVRILLHAYDNIVFFDIKNLRIQNGTFIVKLIYYILIVDGG